MRFLLLLLVPIHLLAAESSRTDTFDVAHYEINLDISNLASQQLKGYCTVTAVSKINGLNHIDLDLLQLNVDSVKIGSTATGFNYNDTLLSVQLATAINANDTVRVQVFYQGTPQRDASWGGFYFSGNYAYNMGVGFTSEPHNYGRVWFPCVDNFIDKAAYDFFITTASTHRAMCNGLLQGQTNNGNGTITWHWRAERVMSTYLASVAVSNYAPIESTFLGIADSFSVVLAAPPVDTAKMLTSFLHLADAIAAFEDAYGPQPYEKVGFTQVPFTGGAMEHAGNIAYPKFAADGTTDQEDLMAHELSHHWWGDMVTCETAEDMWLNEGWASFSANLFFEYVYSKEAYKKRVRANHFEVLRTSHINDNGYRAVSGVPHAYTYGSTVYNKGADVAHTLRGYLGDSLFFSAVKDYLSHYAWSNANSYQFRNRLANFTGKDMTAFFDNWVFAPGFPHFEVLSFSSSTSGNSYQVSVDIRQRLKAAPQLYANVPLDITFFGANRQQTTMQTLMGGGCGTFQATLPFEPVFVAVDMEEKISDAITDKYLVVQVSGTYDFEEALMELDVVNVSDTALVRVEHHWLSPDPLKSIVNGLHLSKERYWTVDGVWSTGFQANATILYNGTTGSGGYLDNGLISNKEDSLVLLYKAKPSDDWAIYPNFQLDVQGSNTNKRGQIIINNLQKGSYALAIYNHAIPDTLFPADTFSCRLLSSMKELPFQNSFSLKAFPNPAQDTFTLQWDSAPLENGELHIYDIQGKQVYKSTITPNQSTFQLTVHNWPTGQYLAKLVIKGQEAAVKFMVEIE
ncbi:MAG: M1 family aminopeptidase [Chitinophagales bacterium]|nr:M1 family aminopeptidase [Chitinophagales bacterium]